MFPFSPSLCGGGGGVTKCLQPALPGGLVQKQPPSPWQIRGGSDQETIPRFSRTQLKAGRGRKKQPCLFSLQQFQSSFEFRQKTLLWGCSLLSAAHEWEAEAGRSSCSESHARGLRLPWQHQAHAGQFQPWPLFLQVAPEVVFFFGGGAMPAGPWLGASSAVQPSTVSVPLPWGGALGAQAACNDPGSRWNFLPALQ